MDNEKTDIYSQIRSDFIKNYKRKAAPFFEVYEKKRKTSIIRYFILSVLLSPVISFLLMSLANIFYLKFTWSEFVAAFFDNVDVVHYGSIWLMVILFPFLFFLSCVYLKKRNEIQLKKAVMPYICKCFGDINLKWRSGANMTPLEKTAAEMLIRGARPDFLNEADLLDIVYGDIFYGRYGDIKFDIYGIAVYKVEWRNTQITFRGVILRVDMNEIFKGTTVIVPRGSKVSGLKRTVLEDVSLFDVYTNDEVEARYLITTAFMERFKHIGIAFGSCNNRCSFYQQSLIIALESGRDLFLQGSLFKRADYGSRCIKMIDEILSVIKLIDCFKPDTKTGL